MTDAHPTPNSPLWSPVVRIGGVVLAGLSAALFVTGFFFTIPISVGVIVAAILGRRSLGRLWGWIVALGVLGLALAAVWMVLAVSIGAAPPSGPGSVSSTPAP